MSDEAFIKKILRTTPELWEILTLIRRLQLKQGYLAAGSIRNAVWQTLSQQSVTLISDVDVVFFDPDRPVSDDLVLFNQLTTWAPQYQWQVKNEVYMAHYDFDDGPEFRSVADAIGQFVEVPTCIGARLMADDEIDLIAPHGTRELLQLQCRPIPFYRQDARHLAVYQQRMRRKQWQRLWPNLKVDDY
ncbi:nucleotidyltransferase family protein [Lactiplantibacillus sp. WILCCON 0030]|uniref:Nucleotidyltransferase family protein n=1 Tax=Lactiplantibacillus brownii TaxID=3069269 RepID=A0ABU1A8Y6_9LACO|nr:nucleotidyltransferase family protein [Lactiplantibacillus brownii]MDQ7937333.1 nucleotidyltransferase family protein [Lactiplantibacillus brownii]